MQFMQFSLFRSPSFFYAFSFQLYASHKAGWNAFKQKEKERQEMSVKKVFLHELPCTEIVKSGTVRLASDLLGT